MVVAEAWREWELELLRDVSLSLKNVTEKTGRPLQTVARRRQQAGIQSVKVNREWTEAELDLLWDTSLPLRDVAKLVDRTHGACVAKADRLQIGKRQEQLGRAAEFTTSEDDVIKAMFREVNLSVIAEYLGRSTASVGKRLHRLGLRDGFPTGSDHHWWTGGLGYERGTDWPQVRKAVMLRDEFTCQDGGEFIPSGKGLAVHHMIPWRLRESNDPRWLVTLCQSHHMQRSEHYWTEIPEDVLLLIREGR